MCASRECVGRIKEELHNISTRALEMSHVREDLVYAVQTARRVEDMLADIPPTVSTVKKRMKLASIATPKTRSFNRLIPILKSPFFHFCSRQEDRQRQRPSYPFDDSVRLKCLHAEDKVIYFLHREDKLSLYVPPKKGLNVDTQASRESRRKRIKKAAASAPTDGDDSASVDEPFDTSVVGRIIKSDTALTWSVALDNALITKVVSREKERQFFKLPIGVRERNESRIGGYISQAFNVQAYDGSLLPEFVTGSIVLPPGAIKDIEDTGMSCHLFTVGDCQPDSLEYSLGSPNSTDHRKQFDKKEVQRFMLSKNDQTLTPPGNSFKLKNHSLTNTATLYCTIIKVNGGNEMETSSVSSVSDLSTV